MCKEFNVTSDCLNYREDKYGNKLWFVNKLLVLKCKVNGGKVWYEYYDDGTLKHTKESDNKECWYNAEGELIKEIS